MNKNNTFLIHFYHWLQLVTEDKYKVTQCPKEASIMVRSTKEPVLTLTIHLTSPLVRMEAETQAEEGTKPPPLPGPPSPGPPLYTFQSHSNRPA